MEKKRRDWMTVATWVLIGSGIGMVLGFGTCGLVLVYRGDKQAQQGIATLGAVLFFASLGVTVLSVLVMIVLGIVRAVRK